MDTCYWIEEGPGKFDLMLALFQGKEVTLTVRRDPSFPPHPVSTRRWKERVILTSLTLSEYGGGYAGVERHSFAIQGYLIQGGRQGKRFEGEYRLTHRSGKLTVFDPPPPQPVVCDDDYEDYDDADDWSISQDEQ